MNTGNPRFFVYRPEDSTKPAWLPVLSNINGDMAPVLYVARDVHDIWKSAWLTIGKRDADAVAAMLNTWSKKQGRRAGYKVGRIRKDLKTERISVPLAVIRELNRLVP